MKIDKEDLQLILADFLKEIVPLEQFSSGSCTLSRMSNKAIMYTLNGQDIDWFYSKATVKGQRAISTKTAEYIKSETRKEDNITYADLVWRENDLELIQHFTLKENDPSFCITLEVKDLMKTTESNYLVPMDFTYPKASCHPLFLSLEERMLLVPFDNDMWVNYETTYLKSGRTSYDVTVIFDEETMEGLLLGALDFSVFKNGIVGSAYDARCFSCISGISDAGTHDTLPHGYISGESVSSAPFVCGFYPDVREALQLYGKLAANPNGLKWEHGTPFGWNSYSALTLYTRLDHIREVSNFFQNELPDFHTEENTVFINLDAVFGLDEKELKDAIDLLHKRGQKVGTYSAPLIHLPYSDNIPLLGNPDMKRKDIVLKQPDGSDYEPIDGKLPIDITKAEAELDFRLTLREIVSMGFDYLKVDFTSHGAVEGLRANKEIKTGRQALIYFYNILLDELDPKKVGREIFLSFSISPLFPGGYAHARRFSCDAFGHHEDVRYVLNALNYSYWANGTLYPFNDPDHTVLYHSLVDGRGVTTLEEARSRFHASVISGTVLLLSDNYGPLGDPALIRGARERTKEIANHAALNALARKHLTFLPAVFHDTSEIYFASDEAHHYLAVFNFSKQEKDYSVDPSKVCLPHSGNMKDLTTGEIQNYEKEIKIRLGAYDSRIYEI